MSAPIGIKAVGGGRGTEKSPGNYSPVSGSPRYRNLFSLSTTDAHRVYESDGEDDKVCWTGIGQKIWFQGGSTENSSFQPLDGVDFMNQGVN